MAPEPTDRPRPRRADVAGGYDRGIDSYEVLWSPVILPPAAALVRYLGLAGRCVIADVGAGTGALLGVIRSAEEAGVVRLRLDLADPAFAELIRHPVLFSAAEMVIGPDCQGDGRRS